MIFKEQTVIKRSKSKARCNTALGCVDLIQGRDCGVEGSGAAVGRGSGSVDGGGFPLNKRKVLLQCLKCLLGAGHCIAQFHWNNVFHLKHTKNAGKEKSAKRQSIKETKKDEKRT